MAHEAWRRCRSAGSGAREEIARAESKDEPGFTPDTSAGDPAFTNGPGAEGEILDENALPAEPEEKTKSLDQELHLANTCHPFSSTTFSRTRYEDGSRLWCSKKSCSKPAQDDDVEWYGHVLLQVSVLGLIWASPTLVNPTSSAKVSPKSKTSFCCHRVMSSSANSAA